MWYPSKTEVIRFNVASSPALPTITALATQTNEISATIKKRLTGRRLEEIRILVSATVGATPVQNFEGLVGIIEEVEVVVPLPGGDHTFCKISGADLIRWNVRRRKGRLDHWTRLAMGAPVAGAHKFLLRIPFRDPALNESAGNFTSIPMDRLTGDITLKVSFRNASTHITTGAPTTCTLQAEAKYRLAQDASFPFIKSKLMSQVFIPGATAEQTHVFDGDGYMVAFLGRGVSAAATYVATNAAALFASSAGGVFELRKGNDEVLREFTEELLQACNENDLEMPPGLAAALPAANPFALAEIYHDFLGDDQAINPMVADSVRQTLLGDNVDNQIKIKFPTLANTTTYGRFTSLILHPEKVRVGNLDLTPIEAITGVRV